MGRLAGLFERYVKQSPGLPYETMLSAVKKGDRVVSSGGLHGVITGLSDEVVTMEIAPKIRVKVSRGSIAGIMGSPEN